MSSAYVHPVIGSAAIYEWRDCQVHFMPDHFTTGKGTVRPGWGRTLCKSLVDVEFIAKTRLLLLVPDSLRAVRGRTRQSDIKLRCKHNIAPPRVHPTNIVLTRITNTNVQQLVLCSENAFHFLFFFLHHRVERYSPAALIGALGCEPPRDTARRIHKAVGEWEEERRKNLLAGCENGKSTNRASGLGT